MLFPKHLFCFGTALGGFFEFSDHPGICSCEAIEIAEVGSVAIVNSFYAIVMQKATKKGSNVVPQARILCRYRSGYPNNVSQQQMLYLIEMPARCMSMHSNALSGLTHVLCCTALLDCISDTVSLWIQAFYQALHIGASWGVYLRFDLPRKQGFCADIDQAALN